MPNDQYAFLPATDELAIAINRQANELMRQLRLFDVQLLSPEGPFRDYFRKHHLGPRLHFSLESSAMIIHDAVKRCKKPVEEIVFVDYGAGLGTLFMLAGKLPFQKVVYNDWLPEWKAAAALICTNLQLNVTDFHTGDIDDLMQHASKQEDQYQVIASRNLIEHLYSIPFFYLTIASHQPQALLYATTTANASNPAMYLQHLWVHWNNERKFYRPMRYQAIKEQYPDADASTLNKLTALTRGRAGEDFIQAIEQFKLGKPIAPLPNLLTNTCDPKTGYWCEQLLPESVHREYAKGAGYQLDCTPGHWDTHYRSGLVNAFARFMNRCIGRMGKKGTVLSPYINLIAHRS